MTTTTGDEPTVTVCNASIDLGDGLVRPGHRLRLYTEAMEDRDSRCVLQATVAQDLAAAKSSPLPLGPLAPNPIDLVMRPTITLVHGAFAEVGELGPRHRPPPGRRVIAAANPLRRLAADAAAVSDLVRTVNGPVVLVGHSYSGAVISNVDADAGAIAGLVYIAAFVPESGESAITLSGLFPGARSVTRCKPVSRSDGTTDLFISRDRFHAQFAADVPAPQAARLAPTQRPVTQEALLEPSGERPLCKQLPSWFLFGDKDPNIPAAPALHCRARPRAPEDRGFPRRTRSPSRSPTQRLR